MSTPHPAAEQFQRQLRSLLAALRTLVRRTTEGRVSIDDYAAHLEGRIGVLARIHESLLRVPADGADLYEIICSELVSQAIPHTRFHLRGPEVRITLDSATPLALALHEMTLNALAHGAFATPSGFVSIAWTVYGEDGSPWLHVDWQEQGVTQSPDATRSVAGFGKELLENILPYELGARTTFSTTPEGARVHLQIPATAGGATLWRQPILQSG